MLSQSDKTSFCGDVLQKIFLRTVLLDTAFYCVLVKGGHSESTWLLHLLRGRPSAKNLCLEISTFFWVRNNSVSEALSFYRRFSTPIMGVANASNWMYWWVVYNLVTTKSFCSKTLKTGVIIEMVLNTFSAKSICLHWDNQMANWLRITNKIVLATRNRLTENVFKGLWWSSTDTTSLELWNSRHLLFSRH